MDGEQNKFDNSTLMIRSLILTYHDVSLSASLKTKRGSGFCIMMRFFGILEKSIGRVTKSIICLHILLEGSFTDSSHMRCCTLGL